MKILLHLLLVIIGCHCSASLYLEGTLQTRDDWVFLARFCFLSDLGRLKFEIEFPASFVPQNLLLYYDDPSSWPSVYKTSLNCTQKLAVLNVNAYQNIPLAQYPISPYNLCQVKNDTVLCTFDQTFKSGRQRWWFVAVSKCDYCKTCLEKTSAPHIIVANNQMMTLDPSVFWSGCQLKSLNNNSNTFVVSCSAARSFASYRERWWFLVVSRCDEQVANTSNVLGVNMKYKLWMTNDDYDIWFKHFSADEFYILQVDIAFLLVMTLLFVLSIVCAVKLHAKQLFHSTFKLYMASLGFLVFFLFIECIAYGKYANDGLDNYGLKTFGSVCEAIAVLLFILLLILMAKGFTITRGRISTSGSIKIAVFMTVFVIVYAVLFIYQAVVFDPGLVLYIYQSPAGYGIIAMRLIAWIWFCYATFFTLKRYDEKRWFYYPFFIYYTIWFWAGPIVILIAMQAMPLWVREKVVNAVEQGISFMGYMFFLILTRPSAANRNFPYHVKTTQIGVMTSAPHTGNNPNFNEGSYTVSEDQHVDFTQLFVVSNTRSQSNGRPDGVLQSAQRTIIEKNGRPSPPPSYTSNGDTDRHMQGNGKSNSNSNGNNHGNFNQNNGSFPHSKSGDNPFVVTSK